MSGSINPGASMQENVNEADRVIGILNKVLSGYQLIGLEVIGCTLDGDIPERWLKSVSETIDTLGSSEPLTIAIKQLTDAVKYLSSTITQNHATIQQNLGSVKEFPLSTTQQNLEDIEELPLPSGSEIVTPQLIKDFNNALKDVFPGIIVVDFTLAQARPQYIAFMGCRFVVKDGKLKLECD